VIGRFLEHSRIFWFANAGQPEIFVGSADWMPRNLDRRVEAVAPIDDAGLREQLEALLDLYLSDTSAWHMRSGGEFVREPCEGERRVTQSTLMEHWRGGLQPG
jgi:polyphosphate kinase